MAEKEERIGITKFKETETPDFELCAYHLITRTEAIERMAKAICANEDEYADCEQCEFNGPEDCKRYYRNNWLYTAEAALNALLEGE